MTNRLSFQSHRILITLSLFLTMFTSSALGSALDSLKAEINGYSFVDERLSVYVEKAHDCLTFNNYLTIDLLMSAIEEKELTSYPEYEIQICSILSVALQKEGLLHLSEVYYQRAHKAALKSKNDYYLCLIRLDKALASIEDWTISNPEKAKRLMKNYKEIIQVIKKNDFEELMGKASSLRGLSHLLSGNIDKGEKVLSETLNMPDQDHRFQISILYDLARIKLLKNELDSARFFNDRCYNLAEEFKLTGIKVKSTLLLAQIQLKAKKYDQTIKLAIKADSLAQIIEWPYYGLIANDLLATAYINQGNWNKAQYHESGMGPIFETMRLSERRYSMDRISDRLNEKAKLSKDTFSKIQSTNVKLSNGSAFWEILLIFLGILFLLVLGALIFTYRRLRVLKDIRIMRNDFSAQLNSQHLEISQKNKQISEIHKEAKEIAQTIQFLSIDNPNSSFLKDIHSNVINLNKKLHRESNWDDFLQTFRESYPNFEKDLLKEFPELSTNQLKIAICVRLGLTTNEISELKEISIEGTRTALARLGKKLRTRNKRELEILLNRF